MESVAFWLARRIGLLPDRGVIDAERYWEEGTISPDIQLNQRFFIAGRFEQAKMLEETINTDVPIVGVLASNKEEALEFILAAGMSFSGEGQIVELSATNTNSLAIYRTTIKRYSDSLLGKDEYNFMGS